MKRLILPIFIAITTTLFFSCDKIEIPLAEGSTTPLPGEDTIVKRRVLIEEFTGQLCTSCPDGAREIERLVGEYGDQIIPISIHSGGFATNGPDAATFVTTAGEDYSNTFGVSSWPAGIVSRVSNATVYGRTDWEAEYITIKDDAPYTDITITNTYNSGTRALNIQVDTEWLLDGENGVNYKLQVYIIEDNIIAFQLDNGVSNPNYNHRHMLRDAVNTAWGEAVSTTSQGYKDTKSYTYTLDAGWNADNCEVVAFIYKEGPDYEVMQANIAHVK